jgi:hypothetical protein
MENQEATVAPVDEGVSSAELSATPDGTPESSEPDYSNLPPELRPDKDGKQPEITPRLIRKLRARYFTVRHPLLTNCGHKLDMINQPGNNCENCWYSFFNTHPQLVEVADQFYRTQGKGPMIGMRGVKFVKNFCRFMATVAHFKEEEKNVTENQQPGSNDGVETREGDGTSSTVEVGESQGDIGRNEVIEQ